MIYLIIFIILFVLELLYFRLADRFNIIDKPNERSSHSEITLRGGGVIFFIACLLFFIWSKFQYPWFFLGLTMMTVISFADDVLTLSNKVRLLVHFASVLLMAYQLQIFDLPWYYLVSAFIIIVGIINAYNFMDGINGITAGYSLSVLTLLYLVNNKVSFIDPDLLIFMILGVLVFAFFNFRIKAKCFAGDVGSVSIAFIIMFALGSLILDTGNYIYILFFAIYGVDAVWTIIQRLLKGENVLEAHRSHLYQFLGNEAGVNKLLISALYTLLQFVIGYFVIVFAQKSVETQIVFSVTTLCMLSFFYLFLKSYIVKKYVIR